MYLMIMKEYTRRNSTRDILSGYFPIVLIVMQVAVGDLCFVMQDFNKYFKSSK